MPNTSAWRITSTYPEPEIREENTDKNTRSVKVQISSFMYDIIVYSGTVLLSWELSIKSVYQATQFVNIR